MIELGKGMIRKEEIDEAWFYSNRLFLKPKDENIIYAIALSKYGIEENKNEWKYFHQNQESWKYLPKMKEKSNNYVFIAYEYYPILCLKHLINNINSENSTIKADIEFLKRENEDRKAEIDAIKNLFHDDFKRIFKYISNISNGHITIPIENVEIRKGFRIEEHKEIVAMDFKCRINDINDNIVSFNNGIFKLMIFSDLVSKTEKK